MQVHSHGVIATLVWAIAVDIVMKLTLADPDLAGSFHDIKDAGLERGQVDAKALAMVSLAAEGAGLRLRPLRALVSATASGPAVCASASAAPSGVAFHVL